MRGTRAARQFVPRSRSTARARAVGLRTRPLEETLTDVLAWELNRPGPGPHGAGLTDEEERQLLAAATSLGRAAKAGSRTGDDAPDKCPEP